MGCKEDCSIAVIFQELLITQTWNKCHWIWHALNPKYMPLKPFQCIFPSQKQQNVKFLPDFYSSGTTYHRDSKPMPLDLAHLKPYIHATQAISMHFSLSKSTKCEIYASLLNSSKHKMKKTSIWTGKSISKGLKICTERFLVCRSQCTISVKINKMWNLCQFTELLQTQNEKKHQFEQGKSVPKGLKICTDRFFVCQSQCTISELCVTSTFSVMKVFLNFWQEGLGIGFWNMVYG